MTTELETPALPKNGEIDDVVAAARDRMHQYLDETDVSQNGAAKAIGIGQSTLSQWLKGQYRGNSEAIAKDVLSWLRREEEREERESIYERAIVQTSIFQRIQTVVRLAHNERDIAVVVGQAGLGKTFALEAYEREHDRTVLRMEVGPEYTSKGVAQSLHRELGGDGRGTIYTLMQEVYDRLADTDTLVIVDQAEILQTKGLELCRRVHDVADVGMVLAGMPRLLAHLRGTNGELKQLYSRVGFKASVETLSDEDIEAIVAEYCPQAGRETAAAVAAITRNTRVVCKLLKRSRHIAEMNDRAVDPEVVEHAKKMLVIPDPKDARGGGRPDAWTG